MLSDREAPVALSAAVPWAVANAGGHGFYRVRYESDLLRALLPHVLSDLSPIERLNLASDTWASTLAGYAPLSDFLDLTGLFSRGDRRDGLADGRGHILVTPAHDGRG